MHVHTSFACVFVYCCECTTIIEYAKFALLCHAVREAVCLFVSLLVCLFVFVFVVRVCLLFRWFVCEFVCLLFVCLFVVCLFICLFVCVFVCLFVCLAVCLFVCLSVCLSVCLCLIFQYIYISARDLRRIASLFKDRHCTFANKRKQWRSSEPLILPKMQNSKK